MFICIGFVCGFVLILVVSVLVGRFCCGATGWCVWSWWVSGGMMVGSCYYCCLLLFCFRFWVVWLCSVCCLR